jgi:hypothetical protein
MLPLLAAATEHGSKTAFYVAAGALAGWAVLLGAIGISRPAFPGPGAARGVMLVSGVLMVATMACAVIVAS